MLKGIHHILSGLVLVLLMAVACAETSETGTGGSQYELEGGISLYGGRNRVLVVWDKIEDHDLLLRIWDKNGNLVEKKLTSSNGSLSVDGQSEGETLMTLELKKGEESVWKKEESVMVLGETYEKGLRHWECKKYSLSGNVFTPEFSKVVYGGLAGEEIVYKGVDGKEQTYYLDYASFVASGSFSLKGVVGEVKSRSVYIPVAKTADRFYTSYRTFSVDYNTPDASQICETVPGYRGIWFDLGQATAYGSKYCGGLGTYTMKHIPMAIYSPVVDRTYFVYGGTPSQEKKYLQCMIGCYDHATGMLQKPRVVMDKGVDGVKDPHDDPTIQVDKDGYLWVFVSGRSNSRKGRIYRSINPFDITAFEMVSEFTMAYPQIMYSPERGFFFFFTRYDGTRQLFYQSSVDGRNWTSYKQLASIKNGTETKSGHYQISNICGNKLCTAFNRHLNGNVDTRTSVYFVQSTDWGQTWTTVDGQPVTVPVTKRDANCLVVDYESQDKNCYIKDVNFDTQGNPIIIYVISDSHKTGPEGGVREWFSLYWTGSEWRKTKVTESTHCYDSGSIWVNGDVWTIIAPTTPMPEGDPRYWGAGGEVVEWTSTDKGVSWTRTKQWTSNSERNHTYVRRPFYADDDFYAYWADGNTDAFSKSCLYFATKAGKIYRMPYNMTAEWQKPEEYN